MTTVGVLLWLAFGANALIGIYNVMGGTGYLQGPDHRAAARADR